MSTTEIFNLNSVKSTMSSIEGEFETLSTKIGEINSEITTALGSPDEAMYGDAGNKVLACERLCVRRIYHAAVVVQRDALLVDRDECGLAGNLRRDAACRVAVVAGARKPV